MNDSMLPRIEALREEAFQALKESDAFRAFKALDDAVVAVGGRRHTLMHGSFAMNVGVRVGEAPTHILHIPAPINPPPRKRLSQGDAAERVLMETQRPMTSAELIKFVREKGVVVGGDRPLMSFGSTLSRDKRFTSFRHEGQYYWWLDALGEPPNTNEAPDLLREEGSSASSSHTSKEGGDGHGPATTHLASP